MSKRDNCTADHGLCFRYKDSTMHLLSKSKIFSIQPSSVIAQVGLCRTWYETPKTGFRALRLVCKYIQKKVKVGIDQEKAQTETNSLQIPRWEK